MRELPIIVSTHALDRALERLDFDLGGAVGRIKREVREALDAGRVSEARPPRFSASGRAGERDWEGGLFAWTPDEGRAWIVVARDDCLAVKTVLIPRRPVEARSSTAEWKAVRR